MILDQKKLGKLNLFYKETTPTGGAAEKKTPPKVEDAADALVKKLGDKNTSAKELQEIMSAIAKSRVSADKQKQIDGNIFTRAGDGAKKELHKLTFDILDFKKQKIEWNNRFESGSGGLIWTLTFGATSVIKGFKDEMKKWGKGQFDGGYPKLFTSA